MGTRPTVLVQHYRDAAHRIPTSNEYGGLRIHALPGLQDAIGLLCARHVKAGGHIFDLGAGSGPMRLRLTGMGFVPTAIYYVTQNFKAPGVPFHQADLNVSFADLSEREAFDGIVASAIVEHLENPFHFLRQCSALLAPEGSFLLSSPNTQNSASLPSYVRNGQILSFSETDRIEQGHISLCTQWQLRFAAESAELKIEMEVSYGVSHSKLAGSPRLKVMAKIIDALSGMPASLRGEIYVFVARKMT